MREKSLKTKSLLIGLIAVIVAVLCTVMIGNTWKISALETEPQLDFTVTSGDTAVKVDVVNPLGDVDLATLTGKTIVYNSWCGFTVDAAKGNVSNAALVYSLPRTDGDFREYAVTLVGETYKITEKLSAANTFIPRRGFVISIPSTVAGYDNFVDGASVSLSGAGSALTHPDIVIDNLTTNIRLVAVGADSTIPSAYALVVFTSEYGKLSNTSSWVDRMIVAPDNEGVLKYTKMYLTTGAAAGGIKQVEIPDNGYVIVGGHPTIKNFFKNNFTIGDTIEYFNYTDYINSEAGAIKLGEKDLGGFSSSLTEYYEYVSDVASIPNVTATAKEKGSSVEIVKATKLPGTTMVTITAADTLNKTQYKINFKPTADADFYLTECSLNGVVLDKFDCKEVVQNIYYDMSETQLVVSAKAKATSKIEITQPTSQDKQAKIKVIAEDSDYSVIYTLNFKAVDLSLSEIKIGGTDLADFKKYTFKYSVLINKNLTVAPKITAKATSDKATVKIINAIEPFGETVIEVRQNGLVKAYSLDFTDKAASNSGCNGAIGGVNSAVIVSILFIICIAIILERRNKGVKND